MEVQPYFNIPEGNVVFPMMGQGQETSHIVMQNCDAVISPFWPIHVGRGTYLHMGDGRREPDL